MGSNGNTTNGNTVLLEEDHPDLVELEERLTKEVDEEFFQEPRKFHTLHRVIDVLGMQLDTSPEYGSATARFDALADNPAYRRLQDQQTLIEQAIEHLALIHCADLNGSVVQVGRVARQFQDAVTQVRQLRGRVQEIQETLGSSHMANKNNNTTNNLNNKDGEPSSQQQQQQQSAGQSAMSLRELWLKKLEAEAVLSLLDKLDRIRAAPRVFDAQLEQTRLGAAVIGVAQALDTMFSSDVSQVQALHKIMEQLMMRKQQAEEVVWEVLLDVLFLRTANGHAMIRLAALAGQQSQQQQQQPQQSQAQAHLRMMEMDHHDPDHHSNHFLRGMVNPFFHPPHLLYCLESDLHIDNTTTTTSTTMAGSNLNQTDYDDWQTMEQYETDNMMIPPSQLEAEFDLESEERRHLEEWKDRLGTGSSSNNRRLGGGTTPGLLLGDQEEEKLSDLQQKQRLQEQKHQDEQDDDDEVKSKRKKKPQYGDPVLALRTLVDCLIRLRRLDDVDRLLTEALPKELERLVQREQAKTFLLVEQAINTSHYRRSSQKGTDLRDFRRHLSAIIAAFGNVQLRMAHLAQIIRHRLVRRFLFVVSTGFFFRTNRAIFCHNCTCVLRR
jgi:hypothetical protein